MRVVSYAEMARRQWTVRRCLHQRATNPRCEITHFLREKRIALRTGRSWMTKLPSRRSALPLPRGYLHHSWSCTRAGGSRRDLPSVHSSLWHSSTVVFYNRVKSTHNTIRFCWVWKYAEIGLALRHCGNRSVLIPSDLPNNCFLTHPSKEEQKKLLRAVIA